MIRHRSTTSHLPHSALTLFFLLATSSFAATVKDYGAVGNGVRDDSDAVSNAIDHTPEGGTLIFPPGVYRLTRTVVFRSNRTYQGQPGAVLKGAINDFLGVSDYDNTYNLTIDGLTFDGGGFMFYGYEFPGWHVAVTNCRFQNIVNGTDNWPAHNGIFISSGLSGNSNISNNSFYGIYEPYSYEDAENDHTAAGIFMYDVAETTIANNTFDMVYQGISAQFYGDGPYSGIAVTGNTFTQLHRMGIEMQGSGTFGMLIQGNHFDNFSNPWYGTTGMSIVVEGGSQTVIKDNVLSASPLPYTNTSQGVSYGQGMEVAGRNTVVTNNLLQGHWTYGAIVIGVAPYITVQNNNICALGNAPSVAFEAGPQAGPIVSPNVLSRFCSQ